LVVIYGNISLVGVHYGIASLWPRASGVAAVCQFVAVTGENEAKSNWTQLPDDGIPISDEVSLQLFKWSAGHCAMPVQCSDQRLFIPIPISFPDLVNVHWYLCSSLWCGQDAAAISVDINVFAAGWVTYVCWPTSPNWRWSRRRHIA
jgi:hypothetical protein